MLLVQETRRIDGFGRPEAVDVMLARLAGRQHGRFATWQVRDLGVTEGVLRTRARGGRVHRVHRGVYAVGHAGASFEATAMAAVLAGGPWAVLSHEWAAKLRELLDGSPRGPVDVTIAGRGRRGGAGLRFHLPRRLGRDEVTVVDGVPCTTTERTLADLAAVASPAVLATAHHRATVRGLLRADRMAAQLERRSAGVPKLRRLVEPDGPDLREALEKAFAAFIRRGGWPRPETNVAVTTPGRTLLLDALWRDHGFGVELDSWRHHGDRASFEDDRTRDLHAQLVGLSVSRVTWRMLHGTPGVVEALLITASDGAPDRAVQETRRCDGFPAPMRRRR